MAATTANRGDYAAVKRDRPHHAPARQIGFRYGLSCGSGPAPLPESYPRAHNQPAMVIPSSDIDTGLSDRLRARIERDGPISFREWMQAALYDEREGYYC